MQAARVPLCEPSLAGRERAYLLECIESGWISSVGPFVRRFEREVAAISGSAHAVATSSGTAALHLALRALGLGPGDGVFVSTLSFIAPANAVRYVGANPVFVDAEPRYWQLDAERLAAFLEGECEATEAGPVHRESGLHMRAIVAVHVLGHPVDIDAILDIARRHGLAVVEDAAEAIGARHRGRPVGSQAQLGCFSFNGNKTVTAGGGGALVTDDADLAKRAAHLATQAKCDDAIELIHDEVGFNYRLSNLHAAVGCAQLEQLDQLLLAKRRIADRYREDLDGLPGISWPGRAGWAQPSHWLSAVRIDPAGFGSDARDVLNGLREQGVDARPLWQPLHRSPAHRGSIALGGEVADRLYAEVVCLPSSAGLGAADIERVVSGIRSLALAPTRRLAAAQ